tara:strand:- start:2540 stop:3034 length:495 start_codon:yes stop_codon:yes gene_type:complete
MTKIVKSISLDEQTAPLANEKSNFSGWVREQLLDEIQYTIPCVYFKIKVRGQKVFDDRSGEWKKESDRVIEEICNGQKKPSCKKCYPEGPPPQEDWLKYVQGRIDKVELLERASAHWKWRTDQINEKRGIRDSKNQEKVSPMGGVKPKRAYLRRFLTWIWSYIW